MNKKNIKTIENIISSSDSSIIEKNHYYKTKLSHNQSIPDKPIKFDEDTRVSINVFDVAAYILEKLGKISTMKLQKLVYYSQAWSLVWDEEPLFPERIEAWANGPVIPRLFFQHKGFFKIDKADLSLGNPKKLSANQKNSIEVVLDYYGDKTAQWLIELAHMEKPWVVTRKGIPTGQESNREIRLDVISQYYSSLLHG